MIHSFDTEVANVVGIAGAVVLRNIAYWVKVNESNDTNCYDGRYWTYNSRKAWAEQYTYISEKQMRGILEKLVSDGYLLTGNYNQLQFDRTLWYTLSDKAWELMKEFQIGQMDLPKRANGDAQMGKPIPNSIPNSIPNNIKAANAADTRHQYGEYNHVLLTDAQYDKLIADYGESKTLEFIKKVDEYVQMTGKKYKDFNLTIRKFINSDSLKSSPPLSTSSAPAAPEWWENLRR